jgi:peptidoglycan/LPS O-acetylase OafA/YrhL
VGEDVSEDVGGTVDGMASSTVVTRVAVVLVGFLVAGAGAGVLWERLWDAPDGLTYQGQWYLEPAGPDYSFSGIALFVMIAFPLGLVLAVLAGTRRDHEVATVLAVLVGACLAGVVMYVVGTSLGPGDPQALAAGKPDYTPLSGGLGLTAPDPDREPWHSTALVAFPMGAMAGLVATYLLGSRRPGRRPRG